jgi:fatty-acyl-CoA synthase
VPDVAELFRGRAADERTALLFEDERWSYAATVQACADRAAWLAAQRRDRPSGPFHVGVLLDNIPEFTFWLGAAALAGAAVVGINPTRRGAELARDITHADCQFLVTETAHEALLDGLDLGIAPGCRLVVDRAGRAAGGAGPLAEFAGSPLPGTEPDPAAPFLLLFTSGTTGAPKAVICSQARLAYIAARVVELFGLGTDDVCYLAMPMFHSNALMAGWGPALAAGATIALRRRFSASGFLPDVRRYGVTYFNYVGKPLAFILATPERTDDADNPLRRVFGNEAAETDIARFAQRFGCTVTDNYGSTEGGVSVMRAPGMPPGALGMGPPGTRVLNPDTGEECPPARFDGAGRLLNAEEAIGELVNTEFNSGGGAGFEGYWRNEEANRARVRDGAYWTGDLAYRDEAGWIYFAGRDFDWLRVDGENFAAAPVERILLRFAPVEQAAVYAVPDVYTGDQVMAALVLGPDQRFDPAAFGAFLAAQADLGTKWAPRFVRVGPALPVTASNKVRRRELRQEAWECDDPVWWRPDAAIAYRSLTDDDRAELRAALESRGRSALFGTV